MTTFDFMFNKIWVPYKFPKLISQQNYDHDTPLNDAPPLEDTLLCDTPDDFHWLKKLVQFFNFCFQTYGDFGITKLIFCSKPMSNFTAE